MSCVQTSQPVNSFDPARPLLESAAPFSCNSNGVRPAVSNPIIKSKQQLDTMTFVLEHRRMQKRFKTSGRDISSKRNPRPKSPSALNAASAHDNILLMLSNEQAHAEKELPVKPSRIVSSPDPMKQPDLPPYVLPPGPYSNQRPHYPYTALIGQAILSSLDYRLTLKDIYQWISIVYPHFQPTGKTWMNSVRHVLSTTAQFRKVRIQGKSYWAILEKDLKCFIDGEYKKPVSVPRPTGAAREQGAEQGNKEENPALLPECKAISTSPASESSKPSSYNGTTRRQRDHPPSPRPKSNKNHQLIKHQFDLGLTIDNVPFDSNPVTLGGHDTIAAKAAIHWGAPDAQELWDMFMNPIGTDG